LEVGGLFEVREVRAVAELRCSAVTAALGRYTNFTNLTDLAAVAVPAGFRGDGLPIGVTFHALAGGDAMLARLGSMLASPSLTPSRVAES
jgi:Asp-tRNA(Asn)/Glu-tRNA(Gln) amidotransferase A subunit family amidase